MSFTATEEAKIKAHIFPTDADPDTNNPHSTTASQGGITTTDDLPEGNVNKYGRTADNMDKSIYDTDDSGVVDNSEALNGQNLLSINKVISGVNAKAICYHEVAWDDDPNWINKCGHTSWENEELNTATRGATAKFPAAFVTIGTITTLGGVAITIYDLTDPDCHMWMTFIKNSSNITGSGVDITSIKFCNGELIFGTANNPSGELTTINFITEKITYRRTNEFKYLGNIEERNDAKGWQLYSSNGIINSVVKILDTILLPTLAINKATGMRHPIIACYTEGGISIINDSSVVNITGYSAYNGTYINLTQDNVIFQGDDTSHIDIFEPIPTTDCLNTDVARTYSDSSIPVSTTQNITQRALQYYKDQCILGHSEGLSIIYENPSTQASSALAVINSSYNTGVMLGDIRLCLMSDISEGIVNDGETISDRSIAGNHAQVSGSITKTLITTNSELVGFSGFGANTVTIPYSSTLDPATDDLYISCWVIVPPASGAWQAMIDHRVSGDSNTRFRFDVSTDLTPLLSLHDGTTSQLSDTSGHAVTEGLHKLEAVRDSSGFTIYVDGAFSHFNSFTPLDISDSSAVTTIGSKPTGGDAWAGKILLVKCSFTAPTPEQIKKAYLLERDMMYNKCTLSGSSNDVLAISYDKSTEEVTVLTDVVDTFKGLVNITQDTLTGTAKCCDSGNGVVAIGTDSQVSIEKPEINLREELIKQPQRTFIPEQFWYTGDAIITDFELPSGYDVWAVYNAGLLVKEGSSDEYTIDNNGNSKTVSFITAPGSGNDICIFGVIRLVE